MSWRGFLDDIGVELGSRTIDESAVDKVGNEDDEFDVFKLPLLEFSLSILDCP